MTPSLPGAPWQWQCLLCGANAANLPVQTLPGLGDLRERLREHMIRAHALTPFDLESAVRREVEDGYIWAIQGKDSMRARQREVAP